MMTELTLFIFVLTMHMEAKMIWHFFDDYFSGSAGNIARNKLQKILKEIRIKTVPPEICRIVGNNRILYMFVYPTSVENFEVEFPENLVFLPMPEWALEVPEKERQGMTKHKGVFCLKSEAGEHARKYIQKLKTEGIL